MKISYAMNHTASEFNQQNNVVKTPSYSPVISLKIWQYRQTLQILDIFIIGQLELFNQVTKTSHKSLPESSIMSSTFQHNINLGYVFGYFDYNPP